MNFKRVEISAGTFEYTAMFNGLTVVGSASEMMLRGSWLLSFDEDTGGLEGEVLKSEQQCWDKFKTIIANCKKNSAYACSVSSIFCPVEFSKFYKTTVISKQKNHAGDYSLFANFRGLEIQAHLFKNDNGHWVTSFREDSEAVHTQFDRTMREALAHFECIVKLCARDNDYIIGDYSELFKLSVISEIKKINELAAYECGDSEMQEALNEMAVQVFSTCPDCGIEKDHGTDSDKCLACVLKNPEPEPEVKPVKSEIRLVPDFNYEDGSFSGMRFYPNGSDNFIFVPVEDRERFGSWAKAVEELNVMNAALLGSDRKDFDVYSCGIDLQTGIPVFNHLERMQI